MKFKLVIAFFISQLFCCKTEVQEKKIIIKSSENKYISLNPDGFFLEANNLDSSKAEVFEMVDMGNNSIALKTSWGKYVTLEPKKEERLIANQESAGENETMRFIKLQNGKYYIKTSNDKFVCCDRSLNNLIVGNREKASDWETFTLESK